ncbi:hypothetical protein NEF87_004453 [Candidatus Lokiarchaeum ossiferum]|uniref:Flagellin n=1 Tax=Candidatus Lokiarchaeum ossiferum TaxID=2951803 RepID=A0ABY6HXQ5_9ARCH|nr:hypothetical protein NEF87_004453 [Candidatus Lokiarchaeum sp. B-35]
MRNFGKILSFRDDMKKKASQGMTAAIILIAFIITASGIAFVILSLGTEMSLELDKIGEEGKNSASSSFKVEGNIVVGYVEDPQGSTKNITTYVFNLALILDSGKINMKSNAITMWIKVGSAEETELSEADWSGGYLTGARASILNQYDMEFINSNSDEIAESGELVRMYVSSTVALGAEPGTRVYIILNSETCTLKINKVIPDGLNIGSNML